MTLAWRRRSIAVAAFALLALVTELVGRSVTIRIDRALSVDPLATPTTPYYPFLLAGVKVVAALAAAALVWRVLRAHADGDRRRTGCCRRSAHRRPRLRLRLSRPALGAPLARVVRRDLALVPRPDRRGARLAGALAAARAVAPHLRARRSSPCSRSCSRSAGAPSATGSPTSSEYAAATFARVRRDPPRRHAAPAAAASRRTTARPRRLFGLAFESRPPPLPA